MDLGAYQWVPIGNFWSPFQGSIDGQGCVIQNMKIGEENNPTKLRYVGLFGKIANAELVHLAIDPSCFIYSASNCTAAICANATNSIIYGCNNTGNIFLIRDEESLTNDTSIYLAGIAADVDSSSIRACGNGGNISSKGIEISDLNNTKFKLFQGGINARCSSSIIITCLNMANIEGNYSNYSAGICATNNWFSSIIANCRNTGTIESSYSSAGICANMCSDISIYNCTNKGKISGKVAGGIVSCTEQFANSYIIEACANKGEISGYQTAGGIIAELKGGTKLRNCINNGKISGELISGGIIGSSEGPTVSIVENYLDGCANNGDVSGKQIVGGIIGQYVSGKETLEECFSAGEISGEAGKTGQLVGYCVGSLKESQITIIACEYFSDEITAVGGEADPSGTDFMDKEKVDQVIEEINSEINDSKLSGWLGTSSTPQLIYFKDEKLVQNQFCPYTDRYSDETEYYYVDYQGKVLNYTGWATIDGEQYYLTNGKMERDYWYIDTAAGKTYYLGSDGKIDNNIYGVLNAEKKVYEYYINGELANGDNIQLGKYTCKFENGILLSQTINMENEPVIDTPEESEEVSTSISENELVIDTAGTESELGIDTADTESELGSIEELLDVDDEPTDEVSSDAVEEE